MAIVAASSSTVPALAAIAGAAAVLLVLLALLRRRRRRREWGLDDEGAEAVRPEHELSPVVERMLGTPAIAPARLRIPPRAEQAGRVPGPGVLHVAGVDLPNGRPTRPVTTTTVELVTPSSPADAAPVDQLWVARPGTSGAAPTFKRLAAAFGETGLWPLLLPGADDPAWFDAPAERHDRSAEPVGASFARHLRESLDGSPLASTAQLAASATARGELAAATGRRTDALDRTLAQVEHARLALAPARRPADVLHAIAWPGAETAGVSTVELAGFVASWEEHYGALLVSCDSESLLLAILRPPATTDEAVEALAQLHALCPDEAHDWGTDTAAAAALVDAPTWRLTWRAE